MSVPKLLWKHRGHFAIFPALGTASGIVGLFIEHSWQPHEVVVCILIAVIVQLLELTIVLIADLSGTYKKLYDVEIRHRAVSKQYDEKAVRLEQYRRYWSHLCRAIQMAVHSSRQDRFKDIEQLTIKLTDDLEENYHG